MVGKKSSSRAAVSQIQTPAVTAQGKSTLKGKAASSLAPTKNGAVKDRSKHKSSEAHAVVVQGGANTIADSISISSAEEQDGDEEEDGASDVEMEEADSTALAAVNGANGEEEEEEEDNAEPSFGELLQAQPSEPVDIAATLNDKEPRALVAGTKNTALQPPTGVSLATVLNQSLKTNDNSLLESCLLTTDIDIVRSTIMRMDSSLAAVLLQKLAERLARSPGRYGNLLLWVQWVCVAHGGAIAGQQEMLRKMKSLFRTMDDRAASLSSLLLLKGKLDMLDAQMGLRSSINKNNAAQDESEDEDQVIYIEGQEELFSDDDEDDEDRIPIPSSARKILGNDMDIDGSLVDESVDEEIEGGEDLIDDEAEESNEGSSDDEESLEGDEGEDESEDAGSLVDFVVDSEGEEEENIEDEDDVAQPPPQKRQRRRTRV